MRNLQSLVVNNLSEQLALAEPFRGVNKPAEGWIRTIRKATNRTQKQLAEKLDVSSEAVRQMEEREISESITLRSLREAANAMDLQLSYVLIPKSGTLEDQIRERARSLATWVVERTNQHMRLEDQEIDMAEKERAIEEATEELIRNLDRRIWNS